MSNQGWILTLVLAGVGFAAGWVLKPQPETTRRTPRNAARSVPLAQHKRLQRELDAERERRRDLETKLEALRQSDTPETVPAEDSEGGERSEKLAGPGFLYDDYKTALEAMDWDKIGESMSSMTPLLAELAQALAEGKDLPPSVGEIQRWNGPLITEALKAVKNGVTGTGINGAFTNPVLMTNMVHASLKKADMPLSKDQEAALYEVGRRFADEDKQRLAGYDDGVLRLRRVVEEVELKARFFEEMDGVLGDAQRQRLHPDAVRGMTHADLFSEGLMLAPLMRPVRFTDRASLEKNMVTRQMMSLQLDDVARPVVEAAVRRWSEQMSDEFLGEKPPSGPVPIMRSARIRKAAKLQAEMWETLTKQLSLTEDQRKQLGQGITVMVPIKR